MKDACKTYLLVLSISGPSDRATLLLLRGVAPDVVSDEPEKKSRAYGRSEAGAPAGGSVGGVTWLRAVRFGEVMGVEGAGVEAGSGAERSDVPREGVQLCAVKNSVSAAPLL